MNKMILTESDILVKKLNHIICRVNVLANTLLNEGYRDKTCLDLHSCIYDLDHLLNALITRIKMMLKDEVVRVLINIQSGSLVQMLGSHTILNFLFTKIPYLNQTGVLQDFRDIFHKYSVLLEKLKRG